MFVVMNASASQAETNAVKGLILAEGLVPYDHVGVERVVIAVVGEIGARKPVLIEPARSAGRGRGGHPDQPPVQAHLARVPPRGHGHPGP